MDSVERLGGIRCREVLGDMPQHAKGVGKRLAWLVVTVLIVVFVIMGLVASVILFIWTGSCDLCCRDTSLTEYAEGLNWFERFRLFGFRGR